MISRKNKLDYSEYVTPKLILVKNNKMKDASRLLLPQFSLNVKGTLTYLGFYGTYLASRVSWWSIFPGVVYTKYLGSRSGYHWVKKLLKKGWRPIDDEAQQCIDFLKRRDLEFKKV